MDALVAQPPGPQTAGGSIEWRNDLDPSTWDRALAALGGHPLQSALWGAARRIVSGAADERWIAYEGGEPLFMARIERRHVPPVGWIGWTPRGPAGAMSSGERSCELMSRLKKSGMLLLVTDRWIPIEQEQGPAPHATPRTIWIDLSSGLDPLWRKLDKQWRYGVGRARRLGVSVALASREEDIDDFHALCRRISERKRFRLSDSSDMLRELLAWSNDSVEAKLFLARHAGRIASGAFVIRCGASLHYFWGGTERSLSDSRAGEAVQWAAIEWAVSKGCTRYDLEGIDPVANPGTYAFKKKMGGDEVTLAGKRYYPLTLTGRALAALAVRRERMRERPSA